MSEEPKEFNATKVVIVPVILATVIAVIMAVVIPEVGWFPIASAWMGTVLFMSIWGSFYSGL